MGLGCMPLFYLLVMYEVMVSQRVSLTVPAAQVKREVITWGGMLARRVAGALSLVCPPLVGSPDAVESVEFGDFRHRPQPDACIPLLHCDFLENDIARKKRDAVRCTGATVSEIRSWLRSSIGSSVRRVVCLGCWMWPCHGDLRFRAWHRSSVFVTSLS